ncbi:pentapeptide repeat-containing protein [Nonomuraea sp. NPDC050394]|uniref:pentapeptide repeat-containing protein n=1 Tax=Nonomuraea sp. NPDC050394 TaxID=3364363 RepID=UPI0037A47645
MLWWVLPGALLIGAAAWGTAQWLLQGLPQLPIPQQVSTRIEALRTALAAAAGVGAGVTLLLAVRRQRHQEVATWHTAHDAAERRVTELYTKAVEQLGNDKAPVRLGGLYALERLAQDTPALRQTVVDVVCAYLRMPYQLPGDDKPEREPGVPRAAVGGVSKPTIATHDPHEERQVRLTAQRILADHLREETPATRFRWHLRAANLDDRHWPGIRLDLTSTTLINFSLDSCRIGDAHFSGAIFAGDAHFSGAIFAGDAWFRGATFTGNAEFDGATFSRDARFDDATFTHDANFYQATFVGEAGFADVIFMLDAIFEQVVCSWRAGFDRATFTDGARFRRATFSNSVRFAHVTFARTAHFDAVTFGGNIVLMNTVGTDRATLTGARLAPEAELMVQDLPQFGNVSPPPAWRVEPAADGWQTLRLATQEELAESGGAGA